MRKNENNKMNRNKNLTAESQYLNLKAHGNKVKTQSDKKQNLLFLDYRAE